MTMYTDVHKYEQYVKLCNALEIQPLTFEEIYEHVDETKMLDHAKEIEARSEALGNAGKALVAGFGKIWSNPGVKATVNDAARTAIQTGKSFLHGMSWGSGANAVIDFAANRANEFLSGGGNGGSGSNNSEGSYANHSQNASMNNLQLKDNPMELRLDTGILNRVWSDTILAGTEEFSPMHMTSLKISFANLLSNSDVDAYFKKAFYLKLVNVAQTKVNFSVANLAAFSQDSIRLYFDKIIDALNCYFYFVSIINYFDNPQNNNYAMTDLRNRITPEMFNQLMILQRQLTTCPVPPKLMNLLYYINGNFKANHLDGSAIIKFETARLTEGYLIQMTDGIKSIEKTSSLMSQIFPEWMNQDLPTYPGTGFHDYNFNTIFTNAPYAVQIGENVYQGPFPFYGDDGSVVYQTFASELDGVSLALTSIFTGGNFIPGFVQPTQNSVHPDNTNRITWDNTGWVNSAGDTNHMAARMDCYPACAIHSEILIDPEVKSVCEPVHSVNLSTIRQAHFDFIDFMASFDSQSNSRPMKEKRGRNRRK